MRRAAELHEGENHREENPVIPPDRRRCQRSACCRLSRSKNSAQEELWDGLLFESRTEITGRTGKVRFFQRQPTIHPEPVLGPDSFVDGAGTMYYGTVLRDLGPACPFILAEHGQLADVHALADARLEVQPAAGLQMPHVPDLSLVICCM